MCFKKKERVIKQPKYVTLETIEYKGWKIDPMLFFNQDTGEELISCNIKNEKIKKGFVITRKPTTYEYTSVSHGLFGRQNVTHSSFKDSSDAIDRVVKESKAMIDIFDEIEQYYSDRAQKKYDYITFINTFSEPSECGTDKIISGTGKTKYTAK